MIRGLAAVVAGLVAWSIVAVVVNLAFRAAWPGYAEVEPSMRFTLAMMFARLGLGALSSVCGGIVAARVAKGSELPVRTLGIVLVAMFVPIHYGLWDRFPVWYHLTFLFSLLPLTVVGASLAPRVDRSARLDTLRTNVL